MITDEQSLVGARTRFDNPIPVYDDGYGPLFVARSTFGIDAIIRARTWEDAYSIWEDEFAPEADETFEQIVKDYGFRHEHQKVIRTPSGGEKSEDYTDGGKLPPGVFLRWDTIKTPDPEAWPDNPGFQEAFGFRPNGPNARDRHGHGIYSRDNERLDRLTPALVAELEITLNIE